MLMEDVDSKTYRRIFKSGATLEVDENRKDINETPSGAIIEVDDGAVEVHLNGSTKSLVTHAELNTALQNFLTALKAAVGTGCQSGSGGSIASVTLDISTSEATKVKTS